MPIANCQNHKKDEISQDVILASKLQYEVVSWIIDLVQNTAL